MQYKFNAEGERRLADYVDRIGRVLTHQKEKNRSRSMRAASSGIASGRASSRSRPANAATETGCIEFAADTWIGNKEIAAGARGRRVRGGRSLRELAEASSTMILLVNPSEPSVELT